MEQHWWSSDIGAKEYQAGDPGSILPVAGLLTFYICFFILLKNTL